MTHPTLWLAYQMFRVLGGLLLALWAMATIGG